MANVSDATVRIEAKKCGKEFKKWLDLIDKDAYYNISIELIVSVSPTHSPSCSILML